jgi:4-hydroxy-tetrahydrodipicolinate synthase
MINIEKLKGVIIPMVSPFGEDGAIDKEAAKRLIGYFSNSGTDGVFVEGTTGEGISMSIQERIKLMQIVIEQKSDGMIVYGVISHHCFANSVKLAHRFFELGVDAVAAYLPSYYPLTDAHILDYFSRLADVVPGPFLMYNIPQTAGTSIPLDVVDQLSRHENIYGIKDSERGLERLDQAINLWKDRGDFVHLVGWAAQSAHALSIGSDGIVPGAANLVPRLHKDLYEAALQGDLEKAKKLQQDANAISQIYQQHKPFSQSLAALKVMMEDAGLCKAHVLPPLLLCSLEMREEIIASITACEPLSSLKQQIESSVLS